MKACLAGLAAAERRVAELLAQFGRDTIATAIGAVLDYAETQARRVIAHVPNGTYRFSDFVEADMVGQGLVRIALALTVKDGELLLDFTGTAPQVRAALNIPTHGTDGHWMLITGLVNWLCTVEPGIAYNAGLVRPMKVKIPEGTILNPSPTAACGARYATSHKVTDVTIGALAQAVPMELPATDSGQGSILLVSVTDYATGKTRVSVVQPIIGGSGARPMADGVDGTMVLTKFLRNLPTEMLERDMPKILIRTYALRPDSGGAGRYRGGTGIIIELETAVPHTTITSRAMERYIFPPPGRLGGAPGATGFTTLNPGTPGERDIGKIDILELSPGDRLRIGTQGGGGFGDPLDRPADTVAADVRDGFVSSDAARAEYGVALGPSGTLDADATAHLRRELRARRGEEPVAQFTFGAARDAHHLRWPDALYDALTAATDAFPEALRPVVYRRLVRAIEARLDQGAGAIGPEVIPALLEDFHAERQRQARFLP